MLAPNRPLLVRSASALFAFLSRASTCGAGEKSVEKRVERYLATVSVSTVVDPKGQVFGAEGALKQSTLHVPNLMPHVRP